MPAVTVALVEDEAAMRARLVAAIEAESSLKLVLATRTGAELIAWCRDHPVDLLLVDLGLPDIPGLEVIERCKRLCPTCAVLVLTMFGDESHMLAAFSAGGTGYLLKDGTEADLAAHLMSLHGGGSPMSPLIANQLLNRWNALHPSPLVQAFDGPYKLSVREAEVLNLIGRGFTYAEIGSQLGVSITTVQTHVRNIYGKLGVHSKTEAVFEARHHGLLP